MGDTTAALAAVAPPCRIKADWRGEIMGHENWRQLWEAKAEGFRGTPTLEDLLALDGYDSRTCRVDAVEWRRYVAYVVDKMGMAPGQGVYEVGCGGGAFLAALHESGFEVAGIDYAAGLAAVARRAVPAARIDTGDALAVPASPAYDFTVSSGVFLYFPDDGYAGQVLTAMVAKARIGVAVLDVNDLAHKERSLAARRAAYPEGEYDRLYTGLDQLYQPASWFLDFGRRHGLRVHVEPQVLRSPSRPFRFNAFFYKP